MSGHGFSGGASKCSDFWRAFAKCHTLSDAPKFECKLERDDYLECVHGTKSKDQAQKVHSEFEKQKAHGLRDHKNTLDSKADGVATRVGLIPANGEESK